MIRGDINPLAGTGGPRPSLPATVAVSGLPWRGVDVRIVR